MIWNPDPIAFSVFGFSIAWYGLSWSLAILAGYFVLMFIFKREQKNLDKLVPFIQYIFIFSFTGARLFEMLFYQTELFFREPISFFYVRDGGLASHGAMFGTALAIWLFTKRNKEFSYSWLIDRSIIVATLQGAIVRLGNFMNSELYGTVTNVPWSVKFLQIDNYNRHPVQLYEAFWLFFCFGLFMFIYLRTEKLKPWFFTGLFFVVVLSGRVVLEFFKDDEIFYGFFIKSQIISLFGIIVGIAILLFSYFKNNLKA